MLNIGTHILMSLAGLFGDLISNPSRISDKKLLKEQMRVGSIVNDHENGRGLSGWTEEQIFQLSEMNDLLLNEVRKRSLTPKKRSGLWGWNNK